MRPTSFLLVLLPLLTSACRESSAPGMAGPARTFALASDWDNDRDTLGQIAVIHNDGKIELRAYHVSMDKVHPTSPFTVPAPGGALSLAGGSFYALTKDGPLGWKIDFGDSSYAEPINQPEPYRLSDRLKAFDAGKIIDASSIAVGGGAFLLSDGTVFIGLESAPPVAGKKLDHVIRIDGGREPWLWCSPTEPCG